MNKIILLIILSIIIIGITSCGGENNAFPEGDSSILPFEYDRYIIYYDHLSGDRYKELQEDTSEFKNTEEKEIRNKEDVIKLAKNELKIEYNLIKVYYDDSESYFEESNARWLVAFFMVDEQSGISYSQRICMNDKGITKFIVYSSLPPEVDLCKTQSFSYKEDLYRIEIFQRNPNLYKNTTETKIETEEDVIALAKNELVWEYDYTYVLYDELTSMWRVGFGSDNWVGLGQSIYIDDKGITKSVTCSYDDMEAHFTDDGVILRRFDSYVKLHELYGAIKRDESQYKNTTETDATTKENAVELAKNEVTIDYDRFFIGFDDEKSIWEIIFWTDETDDKFGGAQYVFIDSKGITQAVIERPFIIPAYYKLYVEFLENRGGVEYTGKFKNQTMTDLDYDNLREEVIELAKNEFSRGYEDVKIIVYWAPYDFMFMVSFWADNTYTKGQHIFIDGKGITQLIIYTE